MPLVSPVISHLFANKPKHHQLRTLKEPFPLTVKVVHNRPVCTPFRIAYEARFKFCVTNVNTYSGYLFITTREEHLGYYMHISPEPVTTYTG